MSHDDTGSSLLWSGMMLRIANVSTTDVALRVLKEQRARFKPRHEGEVFGLIFMSSFVNPDGTTVTGFRPGYCVDSISTTGLGDHWAMAHILDGPDFLFMPKFEWSASERYLVDMASPVFALFSIEPERQAI